MKNFLIFITILISMAALIGLAVGLLALSMYIFMQLTKFNASDILEAVLKIWSGDTLTTDQESIVFRLAQSILLSISIFLLARPQFIALLEMWRSKNSPVRPRRSFFQKNIHSYAAKKLASAYKRSEEIIVISGDYSWLREHDTEHVAKNNLLNKHRSGKARIISYKSKDQIRRSLDGVNQEFLKNFLNAVEVRPSYSGIKASIIVDNSMREMWIMTPSNDGHKRELVQIRDVGYGKKIISTIENLISE